MHSFTDEDQKIIFYAAIKPSMRVEWIKIEREIDWNNRPTLPCFKCEIDNHLLRIKKNSEGFWDCYINFEKLEDCFNEFHKASDHLKMKIDEISIEKWTKYLKERK